MAYIEFKTFVEWVLERELDDTELRQGWQHIRQLSPYFQHQAFDEDAVGFTLRERDQLYLGLALEALLGSQVFKVKLETDVSLADFIDIPASGTSDFVLRAKPSASKVWDVQRDGYLPYTPADLSCVSEVSFSTCTSNDRWQQFLSTLLPSVSRQARGRQQTRLGAFDVRDHCGGG